MHKAFTSLLLFSVLLLSCVKENIPANLPGQTISSNVTAIDLSKCKIRRIYQPYSSEITANVLFSYNKAGHPFSVIYTNVPTYESHDHYFIYDNANRLIEYRLTWGEYAHQYHTYSYNDKNQIVQDIFVQRDCCGGDQYSTTSTIEYDTQGRVIRETIVNTFNVDGPLEKTRRPTYTYDNRGNLAVAGWKSSSYDNKVNPLRQNKVFQFIHRNYSMNNPAVQPKYNSLGLPLSMKPYNDDFFNGGTASKVVYDCQ